MQVRITYEVMEDDGTQIYQHSKRTQFDVGKHYDRMLRAQITDLNGLIRLHMQSQDWYKDLKEKSDERRKSESDYGPQ